MKKITAMDNLRDAINEAEDVTALAERHLTRARNGGWVCPRCGNGTGSSATGVTPNSDKSNTLYCTHCELPLDAVDIIEAVNGCDYKTALQIGSVQYGIEYDPNLFQHFFSMGNAKHESASKACMAHCAVSERMPDGASLEPVSGWIAQLARDTLQSPEAQAYLAKRGLSAENADAMGIRYDAEARRFIVPAGGDRYAYRRIDSKTFWPKGADAYPANAKALQDSDPVFIVEGWEDAASIIAAGGSAVSMQGLNFKPLLHVLDYLADKGEHVPHIVLALDNDSPGRRNMRRFARLLDERGIAHTVPENLYGAEKDANDAWRADPDGLKDRVSKVLSYGHTEEPLTIPNRESKTLLEGCTAALIEDAELDDDEHRAKRFAEISRLESEAAMHAELERICNGGYSETFGRNARERANSAIPTGICQLDEMLKGGMRQQLHVIGAASGVGKTALTLTIADNVAASGIPVLYISLEMGRDELIARSCARIAAENAAEYARKLGHGFDRVEMFDIWEGRFTGPASCAYFDYFERIAPNMYVVEEIGDMHVERIAELAEGIRSARGRAPFIVLDYLQIMAPQDEHMTEKQSVERNVKRLKQLSRDLCTPVWVISAFNRESSSKNGNGTDNQLQGSFRESSGIEYGADVAFGLYSVGEANVSATMELKLLKRRSLPSHEPIVFRFKGASYMFEELPKGTATPIY